MPFEGFASFIRHDLHHLTGRSSENCLNWTTSLLSSTLHCKGGGQKNESKFDLYRQLFRSDLVVFDQASLA